MNDEIAGSRKSNVDLADKTALPAERPKLRHTTRVGSVTVSVAVGLLVVLLAWLVDVSRNALVTAVPLFTPGTPLDARDPVFQNPQTKLPNFVSYRPIVLNDAAFGADAVTVKLDAKVHTFVRLPATQASDRFDEKRWLRWAGEGVAERFGRPSLVFTKDKATGNVEGSFFVPPRSSFYFRKGSPTLLTEVDTGVVDDLGPPVSAWLGIGLIVGLAFGVGTFIWSRWEALALPSRTPSRLAGADAVIFLMVWAVLATFSVFAAPDRGWRDQYEDAFNYGVLLFIAATGSGLVFWRVRRAYVKGTATFWRAVTEGFVAAAGIVLAIEMADALLSVVRGWGWGWERWQTLGLEFYLREHALPDLGVCLFGPLVAVILWVINRFLVARVSATLAPG